MLLSGPGSLELLHPVQHLLVGPEPCVGGIHLQAAFLPVDIGCRGPLQGDPPQLGFLLLPQLLLPVKHRDVQQGQVRVIRQKLLLDRLQGGVALGDGGRGDRGSLLLRQGGVFLLQQLPDLVAVQGGLLQLHIVQGQRLAVLGQLAVQGHDPLGHQQVAVHIGDAPALLQHVFLDDGNILPEKDEKSRKYLLTIPQIVL